MSKPKVLILRAPGTNCDQETAYAFELAGGVCGFAHINQLIESPQLVNDYQILCLPGGFSYGDDIAAGRILASLMQSKLSDVLAKFHADGKLILGVCNGFQILIKSGFLLPPDDLGLPATLTWNDSGRFIDCWVNLKTNNEKCVFLKDVEQMYLPIAHAEGKFVPRNEAVLESLQSKNQLALTYCAPNGDGNAADFNPNGSTAHVAGLCDETGRIFGLMPHPERHIDPTHHPRWTREGVKEQGDGLAVFTNAIEFFK
ncbi:MAG: phosphoribosylformylglycinamidine synthase I [Mariniblastus sp.]|jgi:phosphoribosylformylglycinamidine synthase I